MTTEMISTIASRLGALQLDVNELRQTVDGEDLPMSDRQYLSRCFDLLEMELTALRDFLSALR